MTGVLFSIAGATIYFCAREKYGIAFARFVAGIGFSLDGALFGTLGRSIAQENRSKIFAICLLIRYVNHQFRNNSEDNYYRFEGFSRFMSAILQTLDVL